jgi:hypothetical protein
MRQQAPKFRSCNGRKLTTGLGWRNSQKISPIRPTAHQALREGRHPPECTQRDHRSSPSFASIDRVSSSWPHRERIANAHTSARVIPLSVDTPVVERHHGTRGEQSQENAGKGPQQPLRAKRSGGEQREVAADPSQDASAIARLAGWVRPSSS